MTVDWRDWYKNVHRGRESTRYDERRRIYMPTHKHGSDPFCGICDKKIRVSEEIYIFFVGGRFRSNVTPYHVKCIDKAVDTKKVKAIVQQDRSFRYGQTS